MTNDDGRRWDDRYAGERYLYGQDPSAILSDPATPLPEAGRALDIACGEGRNAVYLAERGLSVTGLDISAVGLRKARRLAEMRQVPLHVELWDLERSFIPKGPFDAIICVHYKQQNLCDPITEALGPGGVLILELHTHDNLKFRPHPAKPYLVAPNELMSWFPRLQLVSYRELVREEQALAQLIARKTS